MSLIVVMLRASAWYRQIFPNYDFGLAGLKSILIR